MIGWWLVIAYAALAVAIIAGLKWPRLWLGLTAGLTRPTLPESMI